jgi:DMSO reductase iron-sulfur subunit
MKGQIGFLIDINRCIACHSCRVACQMYNKTGADVNWRHVTIHQKGTFPDVVQHSLSLACNHCMEPACIKVCPVNAIRKRKVDGIVYIDENKCNGCERCVSACPYGAPRKNPANNKVSKCHFCLSRQERGQIPVCVETCLGGALQLGSLEKMTKMAGSRGLVRQVDGFFDPDYTNPSTRFIKPDIG